MKSVIKISGAILGLALAMTAAYAGSDGRSEASPVQRHAAETSAPLQITVPEVLQPAVTLNCSTAGGTCFTRTECIIKGGVVSTLPGCPSGTVCCQL